jgi:hypothetical protein
MLELAQTEFNGAVAYIYRLDAIMKKLNEVTAARTNDAQRMVYLLRINYNLLNDLFKELYPKMEGQIALDHLEASTKLKEILEAAINNFERRGQLNNELESQFDRWEIELRQFADKKGLLAPDKKGAGQAAYG